MKSDVINQLITATRMQIKGFETVSSSYEMMNKEDLNGRYPELPKRAARIVDLLKENLSDLQKIQKEER